MTRLKTEISPAVRGLCLLIAMVIVFLGVCILVQGYAPGRFTRFGYSEAFSGVKANEFGAIMILMGCLPLLIFCKSARQAAVLGTALGVLLVVSIFIAAYS